jgi:trimethylamine--corrinoid protein Co-methyltransferase
MTPDQMAIDVIEKVGPGGNYLGHEHTFNNFRKNWQPDVTDRRSYEQWADKGSTTMRQRAKDKIEHIIDTHKVTPLDDRTRQGLLDILREAEKDMVKK